MYIDLIGRLGQEPKKRSNDNGEFVYFDVATDSYIKKEKVTTWLHITSSNRSFLNIFPYLKKGSNVEIRGVLQPPTLYNGKVELNVIGDNISFVSSGKKKQDSENQHGVQASSSANQAKQENNDDLPF